MLIHFKRFGQGGSKYFTNPNPEDAELPWAYGGLLNRMSKFYNNDRSSMLNLVRKVKAGKN